MLDDHVTLRKLHALYDALNEAHESGEFGTFMELFAADVSVMSNEMRVAKDRASFEAAWRAGMARGVTGQHILAASASDNTAAFTYEMTYVDRAPTRASAVVMFNDAGLATTVRSVNAPY